MKSGSYTDVATFGLLTYSAAQALRWWTHAAAHLDFKISLETRLVKHQIEYDFKVTALNAIEEIGVGDTLWDKGEEE